MANKKQKTNFRNREYHPIYKYWLDYGIPKQLIEINIGFNPFKEIVELVSKISLIAAISVIAGNKPKREQNETIEDYSARLREWWRRFINTLLTAEELFNSSKTADIFRSLLVRDSLTNNCAGGTGVSNVDVNYSPTLPPTITSEVLRQRTFARVPIAAILFYTLFMLAGTASIRSALNQRMLDGSPIPSFFAEKLSSNRISRCGNFSLTPDSTGFISQEDLTILELNNTLFDIDYMKTDSGLDALFSLLARINRADGNYIRFIEGRTFKLDSGTYTTETSLSFEDYTEVGRETTETYTNQPTVVLKARSQLDRSDLQNASFTNLKQPVNPYIRFLPGNSYSNAPNIVQAMDSFLMLRQLFTLDGSTFRIGVFSETGFPFGSNRNLALYIVQRVAGTITNSNEFSVETKDAEQTTKLDDKQPLPEKSDFTRLPSLLLKRTQSRNLRQFRHMLDVLTRLLKNDQIKTPEFVNLVTALRLN